MIDIKIGEEIMVKFWKIVICTILVITSLVLYNNFIESSYFSIKTISINSELNLLEDEYRDIFAEFKGKNLWILNFGEIEKRLEKDVRIKNLIITKKLPNKLEISLEEESPFVKVKYEDKVFYSNKEGKLISFDKEVQNTDMLIISIETMEDLSTLTKVVDEVYKSEGEKLISQIYFDEARSVIMLLVDGTKIISDELVNWEKYNIAFSLYKKLMDDRRKVEYIDIRFEDFIVK